MAHRGRETVTPTPIGAEPQHAAEGTVVKAGTSAPAWACALRIPAPPRPRGDKGHAEVLVLLRVSVRALS